MCCERSEEVPLGDGFVRHVDLAENQQVSFHQSKLKFRLFFFGAVQFLSNEY
jgi:hypothetical protein